MQVRLKSLNLPKVVTFDGFQPTLVIKKSKVKYLRANLFHLVLNLRCTRADALSFCAASLRRFSFDSVTQMRLLPAKEAGKTKEILAL